jgi:low molecular weight phosphotyrosine protein phosphatase
VQLFGHYRGANSKTDKIVRDPYYGYRSPDGLTNDSGTSGFEDNFKQLTLFSEEFLNQILGVKL